jgi:alpha-L-rhamnosidase
MTRWTLLSNLQAVQSDCPHREKFGYGGDVAATAEAAIFNFNMARFYTKTVRDFEDAARPNGGLTETAPYVGIADFGLGQQTGPVGWGTAHPLLQRHLLRYYGDRQIIDEQYKVTGRWIALLESSAKDYLLPGGIGDHEGLAPKSTALTGTAFFYQNVRLAQQLAAAAGQQADAQRYGDLAERIQEALNKRFLDAKTGRYDAGTQADQAIPLALGLVPETSRAGALRLLVDDVMQKHQGHLSTGIFGTPAMLQALSEAGRADVAYAVVSRHTFPGWGHMLHQGGTTLWEHWAFDDRTFSHNHPAFGSVSAWFYKTLAGIQPEPDAVGFDKIVIRPRVVGNLTWAKARYASVRGQVESSWSLEDGALKLEIYVPVGSTATVYVPARRPEQVTESGHPAAKSPGVEYLRTEDAAAVYAVGSGRYQFAVK